MPITANRSGKRPDGLYMATLQVREPTAIGRLSFFPFFLFLSSQKRRWLSSPCCWLGYQKSGVMGDNEKMKLSLN